MKLTDFPGALREMAHFGLSPAPVYAVLVIALELIASAMILTGRLRWLGAAALAIFTLAATGMALRFWSCLSGRNASWSPMPSSNIWDSWAACCW